MTQLKELPPAVFGWRSLAVSAVVVVVASGVALLLIPQLSLRATVRGGIIALGALVFGRMLTWWFLRSKKPIETAPLRGGENG
jgi:hypothetical protein